MPKVVIGGQKVLCITNLGKDNQSSPVLNRSVGPLQIIRELSEHLQEKSDIKLR